MSLIENSNADRGLEQNEGSVPITSQEAFMRGVHSSVNKATASELHRLHREEGITPTCGLGCCYCCQYHILANSVEAHALAQHIKREFSIDQITDLQLRTQQWHEWDNSRPGRTPSANIGRFTDLTNYEHCCPLLVQGACSVYPVRPVMCRTHFVSSPSSLCGLVHSSESTEEAPTVLMSVVTEADSFVDQMQEYVEDTGMDFYRSMMLLPHWLAIEMGWDFAIST